MVFKPKQSDFDYIKKHYQNTTSREIAEVLGCSISFVNKWGRKLTGKKTNLNRYKHDQDYFDKIDNPYKAYWLGFIMADGCIYKRKNKQHKNSSKWLSISLQEKDIEILQKLKQALNSNHPIKTTKKIPNDFVTISFVGDKMCDSLISHGIVPRKSGKEIIPKTVPRKFLPAFLYGYFDADGTIINTKKRDSMYLGFAGGKQILESILGILQFYGIAEGISYSRDKRSKNYNYGQLTISKHSDMLKMIDLFTNNDWFDLKKIGLERKYKLMLEYKRRLS